VAKYRRCHYLVDRCIDRAGFAVVYLLVDARLALRDTK